MTERNALPYHAFVVRCWRDPDNPLDAWRFSLEEVGVEFSRVGFVNLQDLCGCIALTLSPDASEEGCNTA